MLTLGRRLSSSLLSLSKTRPSYLKCSSSFLYSSTPHPSSNHLPPPPPKKGIQIDLTDHPKGKGIPRPLFLSSLKAASSLDSALSMWKNYHLLLSYPQAFDVYAFIMQKRNEDREALKRNETFKSLYNTILNSAHSLKMYQLIKFLQSMSLLKIQNETDVIKVLNIMEEESDQFDQLHVRNFGVLVRSLGHLVLLHKTIKHKDVVKNLLVKVIGVVTDRLQSDAVFDNYQWLHHFCWGLLVLGKWPQSFSNALLSYLSKHSKLIDGKDLLIISWTIQLKDPPCRAWLLDEVSSSILKSGQSMSSRAIWMMGKSQYYNRDFIDKLSDHVLSQSTRDLARPQLVSNLLWYLAKSRYYNPQVMDRLAEIALPLIDDIEYPYISRLAYPYGFFNHSSPELISAVVERLGSLSSKDVRYYHSVINTTWVCLVLDMIPTKLIEICYTEDMEKSQKAHVHALQMFQIDIETRSNPQLGLPSYSRSKFSSILPHIVNLKSFHLSQFDFHMGQALHFLLDTELQNTTPSSLLLNNSMLYTPEAIMTNGYIADIELLLDANNNPISSPIEHLHWSLNGIKRLISEDTPISSSVLASVSIQPGSMSLDKNGGYNLASDWSEKGANPNIARKIVIESDGPVHYPTNIRKPLGKSVLKKRQLEKLGWEVIQVRLFNIVILLHCLSLSLSRFHTLNGMC